MRRLSSFALSAGLHLYLAIRLIPSLLAWPAWAAAVAVVLATSAVAIPLGWTYRRRARRFAGLLTWSSYLAMGFFSSLFVLTVLRDLALLAIAVIVALKPGAMPFGDVERWSAIGVSVLAAAMTVLGFRNARRTARVKTVDVPIAGLPSALHGFTIAQISDIHVGPTIKGGYVSSIVERVNALGADLVAVTGDLVDGSVAELRPHVAPLGELTSRYGTY